jgi:hypothetical protein
MIRVSILHASRNRPHLAFHPVHEYLGKADRPNEIEYIMGLDADDTTIEEYRKVQSVVWPENRYDCGRFVLSVEPKTTMTGCQNRLAKFVSPTTEIIMLISDDFGCPKHWDTLLFGLLKGVDCHKEAKFIGVWDGVIGPMHNEYWVDFIVTSAWLWKHGYLIWPEYRGAMADFDNTGYVRTLDLTFGTKVEISAQHLLFPHRHVTHVGKPLDNVALALSSEEEMKYGRALLEKRQREYFNVFTSPLRP